MMPERDGPKVVNLSLFTTPSRSQVDDRVEQDSESSAEALAHGGGPPHDSGMNERIDQLSHSVSELRGTVRAAAWGISLGALILTAFLGYMGLQLAQVSDEVRSSAARLDARMDRLDQKLDALPGELRGIADSITSAITATQSGEPRTIIIERPSPPGEPEQ